MILWPLTVVLVGLIYQSILVSSYKLSVTKRITNAQDRKAIYDRMR